MVAARRCASTDHDIGESGSAHKPGGNAWMRTRNRRGVTVHGSTPYLASTAASTRGSNAAAAVPSG